MDEMEYSTDVEYETKNNKEKKKFQLTRGMLLLIIAIVIIIIVIIVAISNKSDKPKEETYLQSDFKKLEERMSEEASVYVTNSGLELDIGDSKRIELSELLLENGGSIDKTKIKAAKICNGYVIITKGETEMKYEPYIDCNKYYKTKGYSSSDNTTTTKKAKDTIAPTITLIGDKEVNINVGSEYKDLGAKATDDVDGNLTSMLKVSGNVDTKKAGKYTIEYSVSDKAGNKSTIKRTINVIENIQTTTVNTTKYQTTTRKTTVYTNRTNTQTTKREVCSNYPTLTLKSKNGTVSVSISVGQNYVEPGYTATDCNGSNITSSVSVSSNVNTNAVGTYQINYTVTDFNGRTTKRTRTVFVKSNYVKVEAVTITPNNVNLKVNESKNLKVDVSPSNATDKNLSFSSSNSSVVTVDRNGRITARAKGVAIITVSAGLKTSNCRVTVN